MNSDLLPNQAVNIRNNNLKHECWFINILGWANTAGVDKYGRKKETTNSKELKRFYKLDQEELESSSGSSDGSDDDEEEELKSSNSDGSEEDISVGIDLARGEGLLESSDEDEDGTLAENLQDEDEIAVGPYAEESVPTGDETSRFAVVNMDWDHIKAKDLYKVFDAFKPSNGSLMSVKIYKSDFGKERLEKEAIEGPPKEIFADASNEKLDSLIQAEESKDFNSSYLRKYQIERLRYFYAVVVCDSVETAKCIYQQCDGSEFESSANFFDLRFIPDEMSFDDDPVDFAEDIPAFYTPSEFTTQALQHSNVQLTWDQDDPERVRVTRRKFTNDELRDMDFKAYIASSSEDDDDSPLDVELSKDELRNKYQALLTADDQEADDKAQEMEITFVPGLSEKAAALIDKKKEEEEHKNESVFEAYRRKQKEKKKAKNASKSSKPQESEDDMTDRPDFEDDFFQQGLKPKKSNSNAPNKKSRAEKAKEDSKSKAELELLLMDDKETHSRHFDVKSVLKDEKAKNKKSNKRKSKPIAGDVQDDFQMNLEDSRFSAVYDSHHFAIDPTNPQFKKTRNMDNVLNKRRTKLEVETEHVSGVVSESVKASKSDELNALVASVKRKNNMAISKGKGKRSKTTTGQK